MAETLTYTCDECGRAKGAANHWFRALVDRSELPDDAGTFFIRRWTDAPNDGDTHLCGLECAAKAMHRAMSE
jgi:hypothetical protein